MKSFTQGNTDFRYVKVPTRDGQWIKRATGTTDRVAADNMAEMVEKLAARKDDETWALLERVTSGSLKLGDLYMQWVAAPKTQNRRTGRVMEPGLDARVEHATFSLNDVALDPLVTEFKTALLGPAHRIADDTVHHYISAIRTAVPEGSNLTVGWLTATNLSEWVEDMDDVASGTVLKRGRGMSRFVQWLVSRGKLGYNPMLEVELPAAGEPLCHYLEVNEAQALADAQQGQYRLYSALLGGTGIDVSAALRIRRRDVDMKTMQIRAPGTKTYNRDRIATPATWTHEYIEKACHRRLADALLFDEIPDRWIARDHHNAACDKLGMGTEGEPGLGMRVFDFMNDTPKRYTMRDHRHTWAVYAIRGGWPADSVAKVLGHKNGVLVSKVYGRFAPTQQETARWEERAAQAATDRMAAIGMVSNA